MITIDYRTGVTIYEQIVKGFERLIYCGGIEEDQKLPSVRELSSELGVNPNTIQKAYSILEQNKMIYTVKGRGNFVASAKNVALNSRYEELLSIIQKNSFELLSLGYDKEKLKEKLLEFCNKGGLSND